MGNCDPYSDSPEPLVVNRKSTRAEGAGVVMKSSSLVNFAGRKFAYRSRTELVGLARFWTYCWGKVRVVNGT